MVHIIYVEQMLIRLANPVASILRRDHLIIGMRMNAPFSLQQMCVFLHVIFYKIIYDIYIYLSNKCY